MGDLYVVRHGETEWSASGRHTSRTDVDLTAAGERAARLLGERLRRLLHGAPVHVVVSPRLRARRTCALAGLDDGATVTDDLREWDYGEDEGRTTPEIRAEPGRAGWTVWHDGPRGGETADEVARRADRVVRAARASERVVVAFTHGHLGRVLGARWIGLDATDGARLRLSTASLSVLGHERETPVLQRWNDTAHLEEPGGGG